MTIGAQGISLGELAILLGGEVSGDAETHIQGIAGLKDTLPGTLVRVEHQRHLPAATASCCTAILTDREIGPLTKPAIRVDKVRQAYNRCLEMFALNDGAPRGIHPTAAIAPDVELGQGVSVGEYTVIGAGARIGDGVTLYPHVVVGEGVAIGPDSVIFPHVTLYAGTIIGARVRVHSGAVLGADGFGYEWDGIGHRKIPQIGRVRIGDDVEIGANSAIDRATAGETVIGPGTKIDNLVQIAHNVRTGAHCVVVAQVGIAGSAELGNGVVVAGQAGVKDHVVIGDGAMLAARGGAWSDIPARAVVSGHPARPHREQIRLQASLAQLPELLKRVAELERLLAAAKLSEPSTPDAELQSTSDSTANSPLG